MRLLPLDRPALIELAATWLRRKDNYQWLDFGYGDALVTPAIVKFMTGQPSHVLRIYTADDNETPIGIVGLSHVNLAFRTASFWGAAGEKSFHSRGYGTLAGSMMLSHGFRECGLHAINTWTLEHNPSRRIIHRLGFRPVGTQRRSHYIDGRPYDRLVYDLLASELQTFDERRLERAKRARLIDAGGRDGSHAATTDVQTARRPGSSRDGPSQ